MVDLSEKLTLEKILVYILISAVLITFIFIFYLFFSQATKGIELKTPNGGEEIEIGKTHKITWKSNGISRVGIVLFEEKEPKWIAKNIYADLGQYEWKIYPGQNYGAGFWIAVFEYPWQEGNIIDFSDNPFAIVYPTLASCEGFSVKNEWPHVPSDLPNIRRVFITEDNFSGDLKGLDGADRICQEQAQNKGLEGDWMAFIGGEGDDNLAVKRLERTIRGKEGLYVEAEPVATLIRGATCHRLLGKDLESFLNNFSELSVVNQNKLEPKFYKNFQNIWLGRIDENSKKTCIKISGIFYGTLAERYSLTSTCQDWTSGEKTVEEYTTFGDKPPPDVSYPICYTSSGAPVEAVALGGLATGIIGQGFGQSFSPHQGEYCNDSRKLLCIEK